MDNALTVLPYDKIAASWHARERARLTRKGKTPSFTDGEIAAIAAVNGLVLVTRNTRDFASFSDIRVESWFSD
jgi:tRNA(fMet)-specific endonuclease VapC